ncbi:23S rRNA (uracil(1939)-C(5))-methyltransferase RlmD [Tuanshanicoccus lijuaniae]|uniref:23S rRNA (uracil(1939)-C(5))-methyltransferase RlmD n=1 Tax=Aerococcaceae bacterium zg-1292 TaxID=2774330 RepID=UPI0019355E70|nr:23S rRNA (uracil(1939)-C(5))-methyltransferase RlmD [Aerococcaceae bacterium zg-1292]QQA38014.1 23S rRNA (uracil(1939)-C(5))-methyltransferase RlmD [Aerococcaceae bacterium zg-1292]
MKRVETPTEVLQVEIERINDKGFGYAHYVHPPKQGSQGKHLHLNIPYTVPGDVVEVTVPNASGRKKATRDYDALIKPSPMRNLTIPHDDRVISGTPLIYMNYQEQLKYKENLVKKFLTDKGFDSSVVSPIVGMENPNRYRNKMELTFGSNNTLGMHQQGNYRNVIDMKDSYIAPETMIDVKQIIQSWQLRHHIPGYEKESRTGVLRHLLMRQSFATNELMIVIYATVSPDAYTDAIEELKQLLLERFSQLASFQWIVNVTSFERLHADNKYLLHGREYIMDQLNGFDYRIWPDTFFQANPVQAEKMVQIAMEMANVHADMRILDLYCGVGTFSLPLAKTCSELAGIEIVESSIVSARRNASDNAIGNTTFFVNDAKNGLRTLNEDWGMPDMLLINPPRSGAGGKVMRAIGRLGTEKVIYVSCSPKSLADDLVSLLPFGYRLKQVVPVDQFPHTNHVECVVLMSKDAPTE